MNEIKILRDKLNGSLSLDDGETREILLAEWKDIHDKMNEEKHNDDENFTEFEVVK